MSPKNVKKCIQVFVSNVFCYKMDEDKNVYAVMTNFCECVWYMKSDFLVSCLIGMEKTALFMMEYKDVDMTWIDQFTDFSICVVEHCYTSQNQPKHPSYSPLALFGS